MAFPREILNELKWRADTDLGEAEITYIHRGAPGDIMVVRGKDIKSLDRSFFTTEEASIPYHRIIRIRYKGKTIFDSEEVKRKD